MAAIVQINWNPDQKQLRGFGFISAGLFLAIATSVFFRRGFMFMELGQSTAEPTAYALWALGFSCLAAACFAPKTVLPLYIVLSLAAYPIGFILSYAILFFLFYGLIMPYGMAIKMLGKDPLRRNFDKNTESYWVSRKNKNNMERYYRQF